MRELTVIDLFAGIGGFSYGLHNASPMFKTVAFAEIDEFCRKVLKKNFGNVKIYEDVRDVRIEQPVFLVCGGFPCQGFSIAGLQRGTKDNRYLWPEMFDVIKHAKPRWVIAENVRGIVNVEDGVAFNKVHTDLESQGYEVQAFNIPSAAKGAWHRRERIWFVACNPDVVYPHDFRCEQHTEAEEKGNGRAEATSFSGSSYDVPDSDNNGLEQKRPIEECNEVDAGKDTPNQQSANSSYSVRESNDGRDTQRPKSDGEIPRGRDDEKNNVAGEKGVRQLSENADYKKESGRDNGAIQDSSGTLVSDRQVSELSLNRGLEQDESSLQENKVRQGNDLSSKHRVEDASDSESERTGEPGEPHKEKRLEGGNAAQSNGGGAVDVPDSESIGHGGGNSKERGTEQWQLQQKEQRGDEMGSETEGRNELSGEEECQGDWSEIIAQFRGVPDGVSTELDKTRTSRLKSLGNAIVPQIAETIGRAIIKAERKYNG